MFSRTHQRTVTDGSITLAGTPVPTTFGSKIDIDQVFTATTANQQLDLVLDVSEIKSLFMKGTGAFALKFNSSSSPSVTINLLPNRVVEWTYLDGTANPLGTTDITTVYVTPATVNSTLQFYVGANPTN